LLDVDGNKPDLVTSRLLVELNKVPLQYHSKDVALSPPSLLIVIDDESALINVNVGFVGALKFSEYVVQLAMPEFTSLTQWAVT